MEDGNRTNETVEMNSNISNDAGNNNNNNNNNSHNESHYETPLGFGSYFNPNENHDGTPLGSYFNPNLGSSSSSSIEPICEFNTTLEMTSVFDGLPSLWLDEFGGIQGINNERMLTAFAMMSEPVTHTYNWNATLYHVTDDYRLIPFGSSSNQNDGNVATAMEESDPTPIDEFDGIEAPANPVDLSASVYSPVPPDQTPFPDPQLLQVEMERLLANIANYAWDVLVNSDEEEEYDAGTMRTYADIVREYGAYVNPMGVIQEVAPGAAVGEVENGLTEEQFEGGIRTRTYSTANDAMKETECSICWDEFSDGQILGVLRCHDKHLFHRDCIKVWLMQRNSCPLCRMVGLIIPQ